MMAVNSALCLLLLAALPALAQTSGIPPLDVEGKAKYHVSSAFGPLSLAETAAYAGILHGLDRPTEWGQGWGAYGKRFGSSLAGTGIRHALGFGLDVILHEDPRYFRARATGFWPRVGHAVVSTFVHRTDSGGNRISLSQIGSAYGSAFLSNQWYPDRLNTVGQGFIDGSGTLGGVAALNVVAEFWPEIKNMFHRK
jgi:hypothetical protein